MKMQVKNKYIYLTIIIFFSFFGMFGKLSVAELQPLGSAAHAAISREILRTKDWLTLHWPHCEEFKDFYQFPPLFFWFQAICFKIFGISDATAKYVSSFFGFLVIILTFFIGKIISDNDYIGFLSAMSLILHPYFFKHARKCELETGLIFFISLGILFFILAEKYNKQWLLIFCGISSGLGFLYKGPPAYCVAAIIFFYYTITKQYKKIFGKYYIFSILIALLLPLLWFIPQLIYKGNAVIEKFWGKQILWSIKGRGVNYKNFFERIRNYTFFLPIFFSYYLPWSITGIFGVIKIIKEKLKYFYILIIWVLIVWLGFTIPGYKDDYYLLAFWPGWCVINGYIFSFWSNNFKEKLTKIFLILSIIFSLLVIFTPIKFDKIRNPEFRILKEYVRQKIPENKKIIINSKYYYDMVALIPWYWDRGIISFNFPQNYQETELIENFLNILSNEEQKFILIKKDEFNLLTEKIKQKLFILKDEGKYYLCTNK